MHFLGHGEVFSKKHKLSVLLMFPGNVAGEIFQARADISETMEPIEYGQSQNQISFSGCSFMSFYTAPTTSFISLIQKMLSPPSTVLRERGESAIWWFKK